MSMSTSLMKKWQPVLGEDCEDIKLAMLLENTSRSNQNLSEVELTDSELIAAIVHWYKTNFTTKHMIDIQPAMSAVAVGYYRRILYDSVSPKNNSLQMATTNPKYVETQTTILSQLSEFLNQMLEVRLMSIACFRRDNFMTIDDFSSVMSEEKLCILADTRLGGVLDNENWTIQYTNRLHDNQMIVLNDKGDFKYKAFIWAPFTFSRYKTDGVLYRGTFFDEHVNSNVVGETYNFYRISR